MLELLLEKLLRYPRQSITVIVALIVVGSGLSWWQFVWQNPRRAFEDMLANNLQTTSVTKQATAGDKQQSVEQYVRLEMGSTNATDWVVTARQGNAMVSTESIATPDVGYIRYLTINASLPSGQVLHTEKVLNVWGKSDGKTDLALGQLFSQSLLDISSAPLPPIGNLPPVQQQKLMNFMLAEHVFAPDYTKVTRNTVSGKAAYTYPVNVRLGAYVLAMQAFAHALGLSSLNTVDPNQYAASPPIPLTMSVDRLSHQLLRVSYPATGFSQTYTDWGLLSPITIPHASITTTELQQRINSLNTTAAQ